jgi:hypothetical protein
MHLASRLTARADAQHNHSNNHSDGCRSRAVGEWAAVRITIRAADHEQRSQNAFLKTFVRYAPPVHMIKPAETREITPYVWAHLKRIDEPALSP